MAALWQEGAVVRCWLLELLRPAFDAEGQALESVGTRIADSGTGRWTAEYAAEEGIPLPIITQALYERFASRTYDRYAHRIVAALRHQFGGHPVAPREGDGR